MKQDRKDIYTQKPIDPSDLIGPKYQIDHIIPISISGIDSLDNKVLTISGDNLNKTNRIPSEFISSNQ
ncbi:HNH endonuclease [bacterium]|nr:HNH endonuclease [bacterium]